MSIMESTHWYDRDGKPCYTQIAKSTGKERPTTLADARKLDLLPSVTSIIGVAAKPGLDIWKTQQVLLASLTLPRIDGESLDEFAARAMADSKEQGKAAAERGTQIHAEIEQGFIDGYSDSIAYKTVKMGLEQMFPGVAEWVAEDSFAHHRFGGKIDLYHLSDNRLIVVDFKTKEGVADTTAEKLVYDEHAMQLAAYSDGIMQKHALMYDEIDIECVSIFIDRVNTNTVQAYRWDQQKIQRGKQMFYCLLDYWYILKNFGG